MNRPRIRGIGIIVAICALAGALAGIAGSAAAPSKSKSKSASAHPRAHVLRARHGGGFRMARGVGGPPVHADAVVPNANGDGFDTVTMDNGRLKAIDNSKLTVTEGTDKKTYGEPTIDVGGNPTVVRNHEKAALSDLKEGDFVHIIQGPKGTFVMAEDAAFRAQEDKERGHFRGGRFGPGRFGPGGDGPPPGGPPPGYPG
ncbi:MAG: hypothetical protein ACJ76Z_16315 [Thermoleophilaceae bacterium]